MKEKEKTYIDKSSFIERFVKRSIDFFFVWRMFNNLLSSFRYYCLSYQMGGWTTCHL